MKSLTKLFVFALMFVVVCTGLARAEYVMVLSDSAGVYLVDSVTGTVKQSYGSIFTGTGAQNLAEDLNGNLYVSDGTGNLVKSTFNASTGYGAKATVGAMSGVTANLARMAFDPTTSFCPSANCVVIMPNATTLDWVDTGTAAITHQITGLSTDGSTNGDLVVVPTSASSEMIYVVHNQTIFSINPATSAVGASNTISGPTGSITGVALLPDGTFVGCEQKGSATPWTMWHFNSSGTVLGSFTGIATGSDVVNDLASVPALFTGNKTGPTVNAGPGDALVYSLTLKNTGYITYPTAMLYDPVPSQVTISASTPPACAISGGTGSCSVVTAGQDVTATITSISAGATATLTITGTPNATTGSAVNNAALASVPYDPNEFGGLIQTLPSITTPLVPASLVKTVSNITTGGSGATAKPGDVLEYTLTFTNQRGFAMTNFTLSDVVPTYTTYVASSATCTTTPVGMTCTPAQSAGTVTFTYTGSLAATKAVVAKFRVTVN